MRSSEVTIIYGRNPDMNEDGGEQWLLDVQGRSARWACEFVNAIGIVEALWGSREEPTFVASATKVLVHGFIKGFGRGEDYDEEFIVTRTRILFPEPVCGACYHDHDPNHCPELGVCG